MTGELTTAIDLAIEGQWDASHRIVQQRDDQTAAWIHAVLHKMEGDLGNSRYWYGRAEKMACADREPLAELREIRASLAD